MTEFIKIKDYTINIKNLAYFKPGFTGIIGHIFFDLEIGFSNGLTLNINAEDREELYEMVKRMEEALK